MSPQQPTPPVVVLSFADRLVAVNAHTGERVWEHETGVSTSYGKLVVEHGRVFYIGKRTMLCLSYADGRRLWAVQLPTSVGAEPNMLVHAGCVVVMDVGEAASYSVQDGSRLWHDPFKGYGVYGGAMAAPGVAAAIDRHG